MKKCTKCKKEKELKDFYKNKNTKDGYAYNCKSCTNLDSKKWRSLKKNKKKTNYWAQRWQSRNMEKVKEWRRKNSFSHRNNFHRKAKDIYWNMMEKSKKRGFSQVEFTKEEIENIITNGKCEITGINFKFSQGKRYSKSPWTPTPDRIDNKLGYSRKNTQWVCYIYNTMKSDFNIEDILNFIEIIYKNRHKVK